MIAIVFALNFESAALREPKRLRLAIWNLGVTGKSCADALELRFQHLTPKLIVSAGFAGGLRSDLPVGSLIVGKNYSCPRITQSLREIPNFNFGDFYTVDKVFDFFRYVNNLCNFYKIPVLSIRCISDVAENDIPIPGDVLISTKTGKPDPLMIFNYLLSHPKRIAAFWRLVKDSQIAQKSLSNGLNSIIPRLLQLRSELR